jgi:hypothetical protein
MRQLYPRVLPAYDARDTRPNRLISIGFGGIRVPVSSVSRVKEKAMNMKRMMAGGFVALAALALVPAISFAADDNAGGPTGSYQGNPPPQIAFDITKADVDTLLKNAPPAVDQPLRVVDMGKYNMEVAIVHRGATKAGSGDVSGPYHDQTAETYIVVSGSGTLATGGTIVDKKPSSNYNIMNGPGGSGSVGPGATYRKMNVGDICIIPPGVLHVWTEIPDHVDYLSIRPDPDRVLPGGYVSPLMMKNPVQMVKPPAPATPPKQ